TFSALRAVLSLGRCGPAPRSQAMRSSCPLAPPRPSSYTPPMAERADYRLGIDLGGTKILAVVLKDGRVVATAKSSTNAAEGYQSVVERIALVAKTARKKVGVKRRQLKCVGV